MKCICLSFFVSCFPLWGSALLIKKAGKLEGILDSKGDAWIKVIEDQGLINRYLAPWHGDSPSRGGGFNLDILNDIKELVVGNRVSLDWFWDGHLRVRKIKQITPFRKSGEFVGTLIQKGDKWIDVENDQNLIPWRFYAQWKGGLPEDGGAYNPKTLELFDNYETNDPVRFSWSYDFRPRIDRFIEQEKEDVFVPFYMGKEKKELPPPNFNPVNPVTNPFDQVPASVNPFDQVTTPQNPFDQLPNSNPFDQVKPPAVSPFDQAPANPFESVNPINEKKEGNNVPQSPIPANPFDSAPGVTPIPANPFDSAPGNSPAEANPFENVPLPGNPFDAIPKE